MDYLIQLLIWTHFVALAAGGSATFGIPVVAGKMGTAAPEARPLLMSIVKGLSSVGRGAFLTLLISGPLIVWLKFGGTSGFTFWFWVKMVLVAILLGLIIFAGINMQRGQQGDPNAAKRAPMISMASMLTFLLVVASAVLAFD